MGLFDKFFGKKEQKYVIEKPSLSNNFFEKFLETYPPSANLEKPTQEMMNWYFEKLPKELIEFWKAYGFGNYGNGLLKIVEPSNYMSSFYQWLGKEDHTKLPIMVTAFGDIFYYRKLSETEHDISLLNIHYRNIEVCEYSLENFFKNYIVHQELSEELLKKSLFEQSVAKKGSLKKDEIYFFVPALCVGGGEDIKYIDKGKANVHQQILFQMGQ